MPIEVLMPALSPTMTEGTLAKWHKREGDEVNAGDVIAEIETDKATMELEAIDEGVLGKILVAEGAQGIAVNTPIALMLAEGEDASALDAALKEAGAAEAPAETAEPKAEAPPRAAEEAPRPAPHREGKERVFASPLARRMAKQAGLDLAAIEGSGPHGRIVKKDIEAALAAGVAQAPLPADRPAAPPADRPAAPPAAPAVEAPGMAAYVEVPHSAMRKIIARRLVESKREAPHFYLTIDCRIDELLKVRKELNGRSPEEGPGAYRISVNDFVIRAAALALKQVPAANATWTATAIRRYQAADISVAVALPDGLITPIIRGADRKGLADISREMVELAARARAGKLTPEEYQGGTFSISNLGMFGIKDFAAVINPPQGCILAVGAGGPRPVVTDGALALATVMSCTLSVDHRAVDGAVGAEFMAAFKQLIEDPLTMLL
jgi:pyruvate dehydrogenase E2 component (dihydrolipoamide acetyltransferase)